MRRKEREIKDFTEIERIINKATHCSMAIHDEPFPCVVPLNHGYKDNTFYFHCAKEGKKIDLLKKNNKVCIQLDAENELVIFEDQAEKCTMKYHSVIALGEAFFIEDKQEKIDALNILMGHFVENKTYTFSDKMLDIVCIIKVVCSEITGKAHT